MSPARRSKLHRRFNMVNSHAEAWSPPLFTPPTRGPRQWLAAMRRFLDFQAGSIWKDIAAELPYYRGTILDVGCGAQPYRPLIHPECDYIGIDTADAKKHFGYEVPNTRYYTGEVWPVEDQSVDLVLCTETLEHVLDPSAFLSQAARCLRPGGVLLITVPFAARWHFIPHDYWRYTPSSLKFLLTEAGFAEIAVYARGNRLIVACYKVVALILPWLMPQRKSFLLSWSLRLLALPFVPLLLILAGIANLSFLGRGGDDCLGYTALATRNGPR